MTEMSGGAGCGALPRSLGYEQPKAFVSVLGIRATLGIVVNVSL